MIRMVFFQVAVLTLSLICSYAQTSLLSDASPVSEKISPDRLSRIDNMLKQSIDIGWIAVAVGFIACDGKSIYNKSLGYNNIETKLLLHKNDIFRIPSQTKAITSIVVMMLFED